MKRMLYFEGLSNHSGHIPMNKPFLEIFSRKYEVHTLCFVGWYVDLPQEIIQHHYYDVVPYGNKKIDRTRSSIHILRQIHHLMSEIKFDFIIMSTFSYWVTPLWKFYFPNRNRLWILHHEDLDLSQCFPYKLFFHLFVKRYIHLTLDKFIADGMKQWYPEIEDRIFEVINPYRRIKLRKAGGWEQYNDKFLCVSIGSGGNEEFFNKIILKEEKERVLEKSNVFLYLKTKRLNYFGRNIIACNKYLTDEEYSGLLYRCKALFVCYGETYNLRLSGQLLDGLSCYKYVIGEDIPVNNVFHDRYPEICRVIKGEDDFISVLCDLKNKKSDNLQFELFFDNHSDKMVLEDIEEIENQILN